MQTSTAARIKAIAISMFIGSGVTYIFFRLAGKFNDANLGKILLWPVPLIVNMIPGVNVGTAEKPVYEATPIHFLGAMVGVGLSAIFYSVIAYYVIARHCHYKKGRLMSTG